MIKTSSDNFQQPEKGKPDSLSFYFSSCEQQVIISAVFFFYEEQLLWVLDTFSSQCQTAAIASYLAHAAPRLDELALLPLGTQDRDEPTKCPIAFPRTIRFDTSRLCRNIYPAVQGVEPGHPASISQTRNPG